MSFGGEVSPARQSPSMRHRLLPDCQHMAAGLVNHSTAAPLADGAISCAQIEKHLVLRSGARLVIAMLPARASDCAAPSTPRHAGRPAICPPPDRSLPPMRRRARSNSTSRRQSMRGVEAPRPPKVPALQAPSLYQPWLSRRCWWPFALLRHCRTFLPAKAARRSLRTDRPAAKAAVAEGRSEGHSPFGGPNLAAWALPPPDDTRPKIYTGLLRALARSRSGRNISRASQGLKINTLERNFH